jgi:microsomal dipeptidase-like Zn-dependent dipeptidase
MADNELPLRNWQNVILEECKAKLGRDLTDVERKFITSRGGFLALEAIHETVKSADKGQLEAFLNSESKR